MSVPKLLHDEELDELEKRYGKRAVDHRDIGLDHRGLLPAPPPIPRAPSVPVAAHPARYPPGRKPQQAGGVSPGVQAETQQLEGSLAHRVPLDLRDRDRRWMISMCRALLLPP